MPDGWRKHLWMSQVPCKPSLSGLFCEGSGVIEDFFKSGRDMMKSILKSSFGGGVEHELELSFLITHNNRPCNCSASCGLLYIKIFV